MQFAGIRSALEHFQIEELLAVLVGEYIAHGVDRETYVCAYDPSLVVKISRGTADFQNIAEYTLWMAADKELSKWLAPIVKISPRGGVLLQKRCEPCPASLMPSKVPACLADDFHRGNIGWYDGRPVCIDYGRHTATKMAANAKRFSATVLEDFSARRSW